VRVGELSVSELTRRVTKGQFAFRIGPFTVSLDSGLPGVVANMHALYRDYPLVEPGDWLDFHLALDAPSMLRRLFRPQVIFSQDGFIPFKPLPQDQAFAMFEWGLNWCVASNAHQYLIVHAAVVAYGDVALILPGSPGSGKSTLCAALVSRGWRLLSDEMTLLAFSDKKAWPVPRPVSLKNESIGVIRDYVPDCFIGEVVNDTAKGTVAHMRPPKASVLAGNLPATPALVVFPKYKVGAATKLTPLSRGKAFIELARNSFNYHVLGSEGFRLLTEVVDGCDTYDFEYQYLDEAMDKMKELAERVLANGS